MSENKNLMISNLFHQRSQFVVIGLTGRTGSGCTTTANILDKEKPTFPELSDVTHNSAPFFDGLNAKRYKILLDYAMENYSQFYSIKISDLISSYILSLTKEEVIKFISFQTSSLNKNKVIELVNEGVFSSTFIGRGTIKNISCKMLDHENKLILDEKEKEKFISYMILIKKFTNEFKSELTDIDNELYLKVYQAAGNSIRRVGRVDVGYAIKMFDPKSVFHLPKTINRVIKVIREIKDGKAFIVIDAIRNPYEAKYLKEKYSAFYLISINAPNDNRKNYLQNVHKFTVDEIDELEKRESGKTKINDSDFISQNVKKCIEISDIHLFNPKNEPDNDNVLKAQVAWYLALMLHPGLVTPTALERVMQIAYTAKSNSGCISRQVGAVVTDKNYSIKALGWNDVAKGQVPCNLRSLNGLQSDFNEEIYSVYERTNKDFRGVAKIELSKLSDPESTKGKNLSYCFKDIKNSIDSKGNQVHTRSLHAEENAFLQLTKYGGSGIENGKLFTTASPCELCAKKAYQLGIKDIVYIDPYPGIATDHILSIGNNKPNLIQFRGAVGQGYHQLYEPTISYKDELNYLKSDL